MRLFWLQIIHQTVFSIYLNLTLQPCTISATESEVKMSLKNMQENIYRLDFCINTSKAIRKTILLGCNLFYYFQTNDTLQILWSYCGSSAQLPQGDMESHNLEVFSGNDWRLLTNSLAAWNFGHLVQEIAKQSQVQAFSFSFFLLNNFIDF